MVLGCQDKLAFHTACCSLLIFIAQCTMTSMLGKSTVKPTYGWRKDDMEQQPQTERQWVSASDPGSKPSVTIPKVDSGGILPQKHWQRTQSTGLGIKHIVAPELGVRNMAMDQLSEGQWFLHDNCFRLKGKPSHSQESISRSLFFEGRRERWGKWGRKLGSGEKENDWKREINDSEQDM